MHAAHTSYFMIMEFLQLANHYFERVAILDIYVIVCVFSNIHSCINIACNKSLSLRLKILGLNCGVNECRYVGSFKAIVQLVRSALTVGGLSLVQ